MSNTVKFSKFCSEPLGDKPVSEIPGVGATAARKLKSIDYPKAKDLYQRLKKLQFDEKRFKVWMALNCTGAHVSTIYKALMNWDSQFGEQRTNGVTSSPTDTGAEPSTSRGGKRIGAAKRPRTSVHFDLPDSQEPTMNENHRTNNKNSLLNFLTSFSGIVQNISPDLHTEFMGDILKIMTHYEKRSKEANAQTN